MAKRTKKPITVTADMLRGLIYDRIIELINYSSPQEIGEYYFHIKITDDEIHLYNIPKDKEYGMCSVPYDTAIIKISDVTKIYVNPKIFDRFNILLPTKRIAIFFKVD